MRQALILLLVIGAFAGSAGAQRAMAPAARAELERGLRAYGERDWSAAIEAFRAGYAIDPHPDFLFPWAQATRLSGDCAGALPLYRRAREAATGEADRADIDELIARCEKQVEREEPPREPEQPAPEPEKPPPRVHIHRRVAAPPSAPRSPWYKDGLGAGLAIGGAVVMAGGVTFLALAQRADDDAASAGTLDGFVAASDTADQRRVIGAIALGAGAGIAAVAVLRYAWVAHLSAREPAVAIAPAPGGGALVGVASHF
jgi:hypothetical protein